VQWLAIGNRLLIGQVADAPLFHEADGFRMLARWDA
jgi:hypothetical protein